MDEKEIDSQSVTYLGSAIPPTVPEVDGYTFTGWDVEYTNVYSDLTVRATYISNDDVKLNLPTVDGFSSPTVELFYFRTSQTALFLPV